MSIARRAGMTLAVAGSVLTLAAAASHVYSPGYTYRMRISGRTTEANGKTKDFVVMSGRAMVTSTNGRLDLDEASKEHGAMGEKGGYFLYDQSSMMVVSPKDKQILKFGFDDLETGMSAMMANAPGLRIDISDVAVHFESLGPGEPLLGMSTTRYRITQDYRIAMKVAFVNRNSTEHVVQDFWMADQKRGFANPFARMGGMRPGGGGAFADLMSKTAEADAKMGTGIPVRTLTTTTSTSDKGERTTSVSTMELTELKAGDVDDALFVPPADYQVMDMGERMKAMSAEMEQAKARRAAPAAEAPAAHTDSTPAMKGAAKKTDEQAAKDAMTQGVKKGLGGLFRRP